LITVSTDLYNHRYGRMNPSVPLSRDPELFRGMNGLKEGCETSAGFSRSYYYPNHFILDKNRNVDAP
jgi:hypothetical protein